MVLVYFFRKEKILFMLFKSFLVKARGGESLLKILQKESIKALVIGKIIKGKSLLVNSDMEIELMYFQRSKPFLLEKNI